MCNRCPCQPSSPARKPSPTMIDWLFCSRQRKWKRFRAPFSWPSTSSSRTPPAGSKRAVFKRSVVRTGRRTNPRVSAMCSMWVLIRRFSKGVWYVRCCVKRETGRSAWRMSLYASKMVRAKGLNSRWFLNKTSFSLKCCVIRWLEDWRTMKSIRILSLSLWTKTQMVMLWLMTCFLRHPGSNFFCKVRSVRSSNRTASTALENCKLNVMNLVVNRLFYDKSFRFH